MIPDFGDYAPYVWVSYGITTLGLLGLAVLTMRDGRRTRNAITRIKRRSGRGES